VSKPQSQRTYKRKVDADNKNRSADAVRQEKNASVRARNAQRKSENIAKMADAPKRTPKDQLARLDKFGLTAKKERKKLAEAIDKSA
jgi:hypothetical protein